MLNQHEEPSFDFTRNRVSILRGTEFRFYEEQASDASSSSKFNATLHECR